MPHDKIEEMTGSCHVHKMKGSPFEHDPHEHSGHGGIDAAVKKEKQLTGMRV